jgi:hypothetical protein
VSPFTQYATGNADKTGIDFDLLDIVARRHSVSAADSCDAAWMTSSATSSGISASASVRLIRLLNGMAQPSALEAIKSLRCVGPRALLSVALSDRREHRRRA